MSHSREEDFSLKILVVGQGGREHALVRSPARNRRVQKLWAAPGNAGMAHQAECVAIPAGDIAALSRFVLWQDERVLARQSRSIRRFGGERFSSTEVDVLGADIWQLLRRAEQGEGADEKHVSERTFRMEA